MRRAAFGATLASSLACGGLFAPADVQPLAVQIGRCGDWSVDIATDGAAGDLQVVQDGRPILQTHLPGGPAITPLRGHGVPGQPVQLAVMYGDDHEMTSFTLPPSEIAAQIEPSGGAFPLEVPARFAVRLASMCPMSNMTLDASLLTKGASPMPVWTELGAYANPSGATEVAVPPPTRGLYDLVVTVKMDGVPVAEARGEVYFGDPEDDLDRDGVPGGYGGADCDDHDRTVSPSMPEAAAPNGKDDDCDGVVDEGTVAYDDDGDGLSEQKGDCDDADPRRAPGFAERADCRDNDCDAEIDEGARLAAVDDGYEANDRMDDARDLKTSRERQFVRELEMVTRDGKDEEWFEFFSQDGDWDAWGIGVTAVSVPMGAVYEVEVLDDSGYAVGSTRITDDQTGQIGISGRPFSDDSGDYYLKVRPVQVPKPWCPVILRLWSN